jgi:hypothetical protein
MLIAQHLGEVVAEVSGALSVKNSRPENPLISCFAHHFFLILLTILGYPALVLTAARLLAVVWYQPALKLPL